MSLYLFGPLIKQRREELGYTQEDLADGICSVPTLSRIENGERLPNKGHSEMLLQRLGYSDSIIINYVDEKTFKLHELKYSIRDNYIKSQFQQAQSLLDQYVSLASNEDRISEQFILLFRTLLSENMPLSEQLENCIKAIQLTCPKFNSKALPVFLSYEEIVIINNIAVCQGEMGNLNEAIDLLIALKRHYENHMVNQEEILRTQLMILYNLSKYLGKASRYDECIETCDLGIRIARETRRCKHLDMFFYNKAWALLRRSQPQDKLCAKECIRLAICMAEVIGADKMRQYYVQFMQKHFEQ